MMGFWGTAQPPHRPRTGHARRVVKDDMGHRSGLLAATVALLLTTELAACGTVEERPSQPTNTVVAASPTSPVSETPTADSGQVTFLAVVDGDTINTTAGTVRIIGIDTPERGECGADTATTAISTLLSPGDPVTLDLPAGENDRDKYDRLIRYVTTPAGVDLGLMQLQEGNAVARYDSTDGYPAHPRETAYHAAQTATLSTDGKVITTACRATTPAPVAPPTGHAWWEKYTSCSKLKKNTVGDPTGPFSKNDPAETQIYDWFANQTGNHGDGDNDGLACE